MLRSSLLRSLGGWEDGIKVGLGVGYRLKRKGLVNILISNECEMRGAKTKHVSSTVE